MKGVLRPKDIVELVAPHIPAAYIPLIAAIVAAGGGIASSEIASSSADKGRKAAEDAAAKQAIEAKKARAEGEATTQKSLADQIRAKVAAERGTATPGLSPDFLVQEIETQFPGNEDFIRQIVYGSYGGK